MMRYSLGLSLLPLVAGLVTTSPAAKHTTNTNDNLAPDISSADYNTIPGAYIVIFKDHVTVPEAAAHQEWVHALHLATTSAKTRSQKQSYLNEEATTYQGLKHQYDIPGRILGYSGHFDEDVLHQVRRHPDVLYIERDSMVQIVSPGSAEKLTQKSAPWGLSRISHRSRLNFRNFNKYIHYEGGGTLVNVYIVSTGINIHHVDFKGRAYWGVTTASGHSDEDENGLGTHIAGTVAGKKHGVAKKAMLTAVKVLDARGSGIVSNIVKGVTWMIKDHEQMVGKAQASHYSMPIRGSVAALSIGGIASSSSLQKAVSHATAAGIHFAIDAGDQEEDACGNSIHAEHTITVAASTLGDDVAENSSYGKCVDMFAPGLNVQSTWIGSNYAVNTISGTSMAAAHVAGMMGYLVSLSLRFDSLDQGITPKQLKADILSIATRDALANPHEDTPNLLAWNGGGKRNYTDIVAQGHGDPALPSHEFEL